MFHYPTSQNWTEISCDTNEVNFEMGCLHSEEMNQLVADYINANKK